MPCVAVKPALAANNNPLPDFREFFYVSKTGEIDGIGAALSTISPQHEFYLGRVDILVLLSEETLELPENLL